MSNLRTFVCPKCYKVIDAIKGSFITCKCGMAMLECNQLFPKIEDTGVLDDFEKIFGEMIKNKRR